MASRLPLEESLQIKVALVDLDHGSSLQEALRTSGLERRQKREAAHTAPVPRPQTYLPVVDRPDIEERHRRIADETLRLLVPGECMPDLKRFYVRYERSPRRGLAGKSTIIIDGTLSDSEFRSVLIHEIGHFLDLGCFRGTQGFTPFKDGSDPVFEDDASLSFYRLSWEGSKKRIPDASVQEFVSGYAAQSDVFEDFAETFLMYVLHRERLRDIARGNAIVLKKLQWFEEHLPLPVLAKSDVTNDVQPWDATKLPYVWRGNANVTVAEQ